MKSTRILRKSATMDQTGFIRVVFPFSQANLEEIRTIEARTWHKKEKAWSIALTLENALKLKKWGYLIGNELKEWGNTEWDRLHNPKKELDIPGLNGVLFEYQKDGVLFIENKGGRALIADEMGLGKTIQALAWLQLHKEHRPAIIVCPSFLKINWQKETKKWIDAETQILNGTKTNVKIEKDIVIINYDIVPYWVDILRIIPPKVIIIDEVHYIKNNSAKRTKATKKLCKGVPNLILLSGTPIESKPAEIYNSVQMLNPFLFPNKWTFLHKYCGAKHNGFGWQFNGATKIEELHKILTKNVMIRRKKKDVLKDLPDKIYSTVLFDIDNRKEYTSAEQDFIEYVKNKVEIDLRNQLKEFMGGHGIDVYQFNDHKLERLKEEKAEKASPLAQIEVLKQIAVRGKMKAVIEWIEDFLESGEKLVVFCEHLFVINELIEKFKKIAVKIDGSVSNKKRNEAVELFQNNKQIKLFIGNKAAQEGLTLSAASNVAVIEYPWTPGALSQRIDRLHRITQKFTVNVYFLVAIQTIEEKIIKLLNEKQKILDSVLDGRAAEFTDLLTDLINEFKN